MSSKPGVIPCLLSSDCDKHIEWIKKVFGGKVNELVRTSDGKKVMHCTMAINDGIMSLGDGVCPCTPESAEKQQQPPDGEVPRGAHCHLEMDEARLNEIWKNAQDNGATTVVELGIQSWGDLYGMFKDPFGFEWAVEKPIGRTRKHGVVPYLRLPSDCEKYMETLKLVLGAQVEVLIRSDDKKSVQHCSIAVNGGFVYLCDFSPSELVQKPAGGKLKSRQFLCHLDVTDPQVIWQKAMDMGAQTVLDLKVQSWGDLLGAFVDTFGFEWSVAKVKETTDPDVGVIPYILSPEADKHVEWIKNVFGAEEEHIYRDETTKKIMHCSLKLNKGVIYISHGSCMSDQQESLLSAGSKSRGIVCHLNVKDPDAVWKKAMDNGAQKVVELKVQFWGDIYGSFCDPFGYEWAVCASATPKEE